MYHAVAGVDGYTEIQRRRQIRPRGHLPPEGGTVPSPGAGHPLTGPVEVSGNGRDSQPGRVTLTRCISMEGDALCLAGRLTPMCLSPTPKRP
jgi:hypothetical protein